VVAAVVVPADLRCPKCDGTVLAATAPLQVAPYLPSFVCVVCLACDHAFRIPIHEPDEQGTSGPVI